MIFNLVGGGSGTGASLNFSAATYESADVLPESAKENAIAVVTNTQMPSWIFSPFEPSNPENGMVWFGCGDTSSYNFNALKDNSIVIYLNVVKQYVDGEWVQKTAYIYQNGVWSNFSMEVTLTEYDLFNGQDNTEVTGGWALGECGYGSNAVTPELNFVDDTMVISMSCGHTVIGSGGYVSKNKIDFSKIKQLIVTFDASVSNATASGAEMGIGCVTSTGVWNSDYDEYLVPSTTTATSVTDKTVTVDVTNLTEARYVALRCRCWTAMSGGTNMTLVVKKLTMVPIE